MRQSLCIRGATGDADQLGYWASPDRDALLDASRLYIAAFETESDVDAANRVNIPQFRLRLNESVPMP